MMKKLGMIFPGQGSQFLGMGKELYDKQRVIQEYFEEASNCLEQNFVRLCFASSEKELRETVNAQTSIFLVSASLFMLLKTKYGIQPDLVAGHSSGEYAAIFASGGMSFADALYLLKKRALFMEEATSQFPGGMVAILGLPYETVQKICAQCDNATSVTEVAEVVNYNSPTQVVVSGTSPTLEQVQTLVREQGGKTIPLNVAGAFHSRLMKEAADKFAQYMIKVDFKNLSVPLVNNIQAMLVESNDSIKESLEKQMACPVAWWPSMEKFKECDIIVEVGPDEKLSKMLKREWPDKEIFAINSMQDIEHLLQLLGKEVIKQEHGACCGSPGCTGEDCALEEMVVVEEIPVVQPEEIIIAQEHKEDQIRE